MTVKTVVLALVGASSVVAVGTASYLAGRGNTMPAAVRAQDEVASRGLTEVAVVEPPQPPAVVPAVAPPPAPIPVETPRVRPKSVKRAPRPARSSASPSPAPPSPAPPTATPASAPPAAAPESQFPRVDQPATVPAGVETLPPPTTSEDATQTVKPPENTSGRGGRSTAAVPALESVVVKTDSVVGVRLETPVSSETAKVEDKIVARVTRDLTVDDRTAIPAGSKLEGYVTVVERGGKFKDAARIGIRFTTLVSSDGKIRTPMQTDTIFRTADSPAGQATTRIGTGAVVGAILGAVIGGKRGAIIGGTAGAGGGAATVAAGDRSDVTIPAGTPLTVRLTAPLTVTIEREIDRAG